MPDLVPIVGTVLLWTFGPITLIIMGVGVAYHLRIRKLRRR